MKKITMLPFIFLLFGCGENTKLINLPDGLSWGMTTEDVKDKGFILTQKRKFEDKTFYSFKSKSFKNMDQKGLGFNEDNGLINYSASMHYYPLITGHDDIQDPTGEKAIELYNSYTNEFDKVYRPDKVDGEAAQPSDNFWIKQTCEEQFCFILMKTYKDKSTELKVALYYVNLDKERTGVVSISYNKIIN